MTEHQGTISPNGTYIHIIIIIIDESKYMRTVFSDSENSTCSFIWHLQQMVYMIFILSEFLFAFHEKKNSQTLMSRLAYCLLDLHSLLFDLMSSHVCYRDGQKVRERESELSIVTPTITHIRTRFITNLNLSKGIIHAWLIRLMCSSENCTTLSFILHLCRVSRCYSFTIISFFFHLA